MKAAFRMTTAPRLDVSRMSSTTRALEAHGNSLGGAPQFRHAFILRLGLGFRFHRLDPAALDPRGLSYLCAGSSYSFIQSCYPSISFVETSGYEFAEFIPEFPPQSGLSCMAG